MGIAAVFTKSRQPVCYINPLSSSRGSFSHRLLRRFLPEDRARYDIWLEWTMIKRSSKTTLLRKYSQMYNGLLTCVLFQSELPPCTCVISLNSMHACAVVCAYIYIWKSLPQELNICCTMCTLIARFMGPTWGQSGADGTQVGPMLAP